MGARFGSFEIEGKLGEGGLGESWLARHPAGHHAVVKMLWPHVSALPIEQLCIPPAQAMSRLADAQLAKVYDAGRMTDGRAYVMTAHVPGESLASRIARGRHSLTQVADIAHQVARALATANAAGVVHNNLKPSNIFIVPDLERTRGERVVVSDAVFGAVIAAMPGAGHPGYLAPEQHGGGGEPRSDIYALGCIAFELLTTRPPFAAESAATLRDHHMHTPAARLRTLVPDVGAVMDTLLARMLEKHPDDRPRSVKEVARLFDLMLSANAPVGETVQ